MRIGAGSARYADPGYLDDGDPRLPLDSVSSARLALDWLAGPPGSRYSVAQLKRMRRRIRQVLAELGE